MVCEPQKSAFFRANFPKNMLKLIHNVKKPIIMERMMADRMEFCRDYGNWTQDCDGVLFTDEVNFIFSFVGYF